MKPLLYILLLSIISAFVTDFLLYSQNNLIQNDRWIGKKRMLKVGLNGADDFLLSRSTLTKNKLSLASYFGYQEIYSKKKFTPHLISFDVKIPANGYLDFFLKLENKKEWGVRFNRSEHKKSFIFLKTKSGFFEKKIFLNQIKTIKQKNLVVLRFIDHQIEIQLNSIREKNTISKKKLFGAIGFHAGSNGAIVDNIIVKDKNEEVFKESFRRLDKWFPTIFIIFLFIFLLIELLQYLRRIFFFQREKALPMNIRFFLTLQILMLISSFYAFDYFFWSKQQFYNQTKLLFQNKRVDTPFIETKRFSFFQTIAKSLLINKDEKVLFKKNYYPRRIFEGPVLCSSLSENCINNNSEKEIDLSFSKYDKCSRILFMGTSQTVGAGASEINNTFFVKTHSNLANHFKGQCITSLNISISASGVIRLINHYKSKYIHFRPHLMVINLGTNDSLETLREYLPKVFNLNKKLNTQSLFVEELNSRLSPYMDQATKYGALRETISIAKVAFLSIHNHFFDLESREVGILWWDPIHLSDYGQERLSEKLTEKILKTWRPKSSADLLKTL